MASTSKKTQRPESLNKELSPDQKLSLVSLGLMQKLSQKDPSFNWLEDEHSEKLYIKKLRDRLELIQLALGTGAPLSTTEISFLMGAKPGKKTVERGGLIATKISRNIWKLSKNNAEKNYWRN
tara:strand:- start:65758 stop:66126 length:369 start_codon:yes stop_codon:yes gene_type:complete